MMKLSIIFILIWGFLIGMPLFANNEDISKINLNSSSDLKIYTPIKASGNKADVSADKFITVYVALVVAAGFVLYRLIKKGGVRLPMKSENASNLKVLETRIIGNRQYLMVVSYDDIKVMIGTTPTSIQYICTLDSLEPSSPDLNQKSIPTYQSQQDSSGHRKINLKFPFIH